MLEASDYPRAAYDRAIGACDEFDACATEYQMLLDTQRALLADGNIGGTVQTLRRGDTVARRAASCMRRFTPVQEALASGIYAGPRVDELRRRLARAGSLGDRVNVGIAQLGALYAARRDAAAVELQRDHATQNAQRRSGYAAAPSSSAIDVRR